MLPIMQQSIVELLLPEYRRRVLGLLLLRPEEALHGREIARRTGLSAGAVARELAKLSDVGLLNRVRRGNQQLFSANTSCPVFVELASILRKTSGMAEMLGQSLAPVAPNLEAAFVFGSVARGQETAGSDIDLMLVGDVSFGQVVGLLHPVQIALGREVNPKIFSASEFASRAASDSFLRDVLAKPKIFLIGSEDDLAELAGHFA